MPLNKETKPIQLIIVLFYHNTLGRYTLYHYYYFIIIYKILHFSIKMFWTLYLKSRELSHFIWPLCKKQWKFWWYDNKHQMFEIYFDHNDSTISCCNYLTFFLTCFAFVNLSCTEENFECFEYFLLNVI